MVNLSSHLDPLLWLLNPSLQTEAKMFGPTYIPGLWHSQGKDPFYSRVEPPDEGWGPMHES